MKRPSARAPTAMWLAAPLSPEVSRSLERLSLARGARRLAVMPDVHLARDVCVGVVLASDARIYPGAVGGDIGCGMAALAFDGDAALLADERRAGRLLLSLHEQVPASKHGPSTVVAQLPAELQVAPLSDAPLERIKKREARLELGTLGRGNHFLELQRDDEGRLWLMLHSGSRAVGQAVLDHHLRRAATDDRLPYLLADGEAGRAYLADHDWAVRYAELSRQQMAERASELMRRLFAVEADWRTFVQCTHNHVRVETHLGERLWVHRKGALAAAAGAPGMIPGSMGTASYHVTGRGHAPALCSSSHGAGRELARGEARRRIGVNALEREMGAVLFDHRRARELCEEAPSAYRDIVKVMRAQRELTRIDRKLYPILSYKGI